ncbi:hypothetical protein CSOJ01_08184 [Colletotrichum sojae]|uniref:Uncharacterized protein n=1 Tax=Colletotrichum sojae TaxID=2175907 RepID=A0A8H6MTB2_9PEZI|nr:hypothetical protein CSOJ01_08184 [Colletotrichum sojae]
MNRSDNWRSVFSLSQSARKKKKTAKPAKGSPSPSPPPSQTVSFPDPPRTSQAPRRHTMPGPSPMATLPVQSPDSDVSPKTAAQKKDEDKADYFSNEFQKVDDEDEGEGEGSSTESSPVESTKSESRAERQRGSSISSLAFAPVRNLSLPQGNQKTTNKDRIRASSPPPNR